MKKILKSLVKFVKTVSEILARFILAVVYLVLLFPLGIIINFFYDFLEIKSGIPRWLPQRKVENIREYLMSQ